MLTRIGGSCFPSFVTLSFHCIATVMSSSNEKAIHLTQTEGMSPIFSSLDDLFDMSCYNLEDVYGCDSAQTQSTSIRPVHPSSDPSSSRKVVEPKDASSDAKSNQIGEETVDAAGDNDRVDVINAVHDINTIAKTEERTTLRRPRRASYNSAENYSDWTKMQSKDFIRHNLLKLYDVLQIQDKGAENVRLRALWSRRFRNRADAELSQDLLSEDIEKHIAVINRLCLRVKTTFDHFYIGERQMLAQKLNKYWKVEPAKAHNRFSDRIRRFPELLDLVRSENEEDVGTAARLLVPRGYKYNGKGRKARKAGDTETIVTADPLDATSESDKDP